MKKRTHAYILVAALSGLIPRVTHATEPPTISAEESSKNQARDMFAKGLEYYKAGRYADAYAQFRASWSNYQHYGTAANLADCELRLGKTRDAAEHLAYALRTQPADAPERGATESAYEKALRSVGAIHVSAPEGADIRVDGKVIGQAPLSDPVFVDPGAHEIGMISGETSVTESVEVRAGEARELSLQPRGDDTEGAAPVTPEKPPASSGKLSPIVPVGIGLTVVGLGVGALLTVLSSNHAASADEQLRALGGSASACSGASALATCNAIDDDLGSRDALATGAVVSFIAGGVIGAGTLVYALTAPKSHQKNTAFHVTPWIAPEMGGAFLRGNF